MADTSFLAVSPTLGDGFDIGTGTVIESVVNAEFGEFPTLEDVDSDVDLDNLRDLHGRAVEGFRDMVAALHTIAHDDDPSLNAAGRLKIAARMVEAKHAELADAARRELEHVEAQIEQERAAVYTDIRRAPPTDLSIHSDIRAHFKAMDPNITIAEVYRAVERCDLLAAQAIALAPPYLSGLKGPGGDAAHQAAKDFITRLLAGPRLRRIEALQSASFAAARAMAALDTKARKFIDFDRAKGLSEREAKRITKETA